MTMMSADAFARMLDEYRQLTERIDKLNTFLTRVTTGVPDKAEREDLRDQLRSMDTYQEILLRRIQRHAARFALDGKMVMVDSRESVY